MNFDYLLSEFKREFEVKKSDKRRYVLSFDYRLSYMNIIATLGSAIYTVCLSFPKDSEEHIKLFNLHEEIDAYYESLDPTVEWK